MIPITFGTPINKYKPLIFNKLALQGPNIFTNFPTTKLVVYEIWHEAYPNYFYFLSSSPTLRASPCLDSLKELFTTKVHSTPKAQTITLTQGNQYNVYHRKFGSIYEDLFFAQQNRYEAFLYFPKGRTLDFHIHEVKIAKSWANHFTHKKQGLF